MHRLVYLLGHAAPLRRVGQHAPQRADRVWQQVVPAAAVGRSSGGRVSLPGGTNNSVSRLFPVCSSMALLGSCRVQPNAQVPILTACPACNSPQLVLQLGHQVSLAWPAKLFERSAVPHFILYLFEQVVLLGQVTRWACGW